LTGSQEVEGSNPFFSTTLKEGFTDKKSYRSYFCNFFFVIIFDFIWSIVVVWLILSMKSLSPFDLTWLLDKKQEIKDKPKHYMIYLRVYSRLEKKYSQLTTRVVANQELKE
tara:strand:+ start:186 stop:518 length:333 start_codon:yes stop_codon:yes gene_type:complete